MMRKGTCKSHFNESKKLQNTLKNDKNYKSHLTCQYKDTAELHFLANG